MNLKAIILDIDGTLFNSQKTISERTKKWTDALIEALKNDWRFSLDWYTWVIDLENLKKDSLVIATKIELLLRNNRYFDESSIYITDDILSRDQQNNFINLIYSNAKPWVNPNIRYIDDTNYLIHTLNVVWEWWINNINQARKIEWLSPVSTWKWKPINTRAFILNNDAVEIYRRVNWNEIQALQK